MKLKKKNKKKNFFFFLFFLIFFFWKKSPESAPKFSGRSGNRKHNYFFFWPYTGRLYMWLIYLWHPLPLHSFPLYFLEPGINRSYRHSTEYSLFLLPTSHCRGSLTSDIIIVTDGTHHECYLPSCPCSNLGHPSSY